MTGTHCQAEIISVGTELLRGEIVDTNASYLAAELPLLGITLHAMSTVGDDRNQLCQAIQRGLERSDLVITGGGLGPTEDDLTRECIATVLGEELSVDPQLETELRGMFARMGRDMPVHNLRQAVLIPSAAALPNPRGTAPGWWVEKHGKVIVALPGPPREMMPMWRNQVVPRLHKRFPGETILSLTVKTFTVPEARVSELVQPIFQTDTPQIGIYSKADGIHIRLIAQGQDAQQVLDATGASLSEMFAPYVWGRNDDTLEELACRLLGSHGLTLATMEDGTGGLIASSITAAVSGPTCFRGGLIACSTESKVYWGVPAELIREHGAISAEVAAAMASTARERLSADLGLGITGIAGPDSPAGKQPGLAFIGVAHSRGTRTWQQSFPPSLADARERAAVAALFRLRETLLELGLPAA